MFNWCLLKNYIMWLQKYVRMNVINIYTKLGLNSYIKVRDLESLIDLTYKAFL